MQVPSFFGPYSRETAANINRIMESGPRSRIGSPSVRLLPPPRTRFRPSRRRRRQRRSEGSPGL